jgi:hypothetical protein
MCKKIAVVVRDERQSEALRMSAGITMMDDEIEMFFLDVTLMDDEKTAMNLEIAEEMELPFYTNVKENTEMTYMDTTALHEKLREYDHIVVY